MTLSLYAMAFSSNCLVRGPLNGIEVHAFLEHLPQGRELAELRDLALDQVDRVVDLLLGRETSDREADRAVRELVAAAERAQHVRGLERGRSARRARRDGDFLHRHDQALALDEVEADVEVVRDSPLH